MSELELGVLVELQREIRALRNEVATLTAVVKKDKVSDVWIDEKTAAQMLGIVGRTLRSQCKTGHLPINYRNTNNRNWHYAKKDLLKYQQQTSTII